MDASDTRNDTANRQQIHEKMPLISDLPLSIRSINALTAAGYRFAYELEELDYDKLKAIRWIGKKSAKEILSCCRRSRKPVPDPVPVLRSDRIEGDACLLDLTLSDRTKHLLYEANCHYISDIIALGYDGAASIGAADGETVREIQGFLRHISLVGQPPISNFLNQTPIMKLRILQRTRYALIRAGYCVVGDLRGVDYESLRAKKGISDKAARELLDYIRQNPVAADTPEGRVSGDCLISYLSFLPHVHKNLKINGYRFMSELLRLGCDGLMAAGISGKKNVQKIWDSLRSVSIVADASVIRTAPRERDILFAELQQAYGNSRSFWCHEFMAAKYQAPNQSEARPLLCLYEREAACDAAKAKVMKLLDEHGDRISRSSLEQLLPGHLHGTPIVDNILNQLLADRKIVVEGTDICRYYLTALQFVNSHLNGKSRTIMQMLLRGCTVKQILSETNLSRQRFILFRNRALRRRPRLKEDRYLSLFSRYDFTPDTFRLAFGEPTAVYYYLKLVDKTKRITKKRLIKILSDPTVSPELKKRLEPIANSECMIIDGVCINTNLTDMVRYFIATFCRDTTTDEDFITGYRRWLDVLNLADAPQLRLNLSNSVCLPHTNYVLRKGGHRFRYYDWTAYDFGPLPEKLQIEQYQNIEISVLKLFSAHPDLMQQYDIRDEDELYSILKRVWPKDNQKVQFIRQPIIRIGNADSLKQALNIIYRFGPLRIEELCTRYEEMYGVKAMSVLTDCCKGLEKYCRNGLCSLKGTDIAELSETAQDPTAVKPRKSPRKPAAGRKRTPAKKRTAGNKDDSPQ